ncbi:discoidin domain-containing protein, partial [Pseudoduganella sp. RAF53_2]|uniref:discoidin domain-containing protein n=1 Tax=Pseudoduganella sp. RAF53_2 TaxID=3233060 RepID=UPI003F9B50E5
MLAACGGSSEDSGSQAQGGLRLAASVARASAEMALTPVAATASSSERGDLNAAAAIDHNPGTRWGSGFTDNEFLTLDYGKSVNITRVHIDWENAHATQY